MSKKTLPNKGTIWFDKFVEENKDEILAHGKKLDVAVQAKIKRDSAFKKIFHFLYYKLPEYLLGLNILAFALDFTFSLILFSFTEELN